MRFAGAIAATLGMISSSAMAASATWSATPTNGNWVATGADDNWSTGAATFPGSTAGTPFTNADVATFSGASSTPSVLINDASLNIGGITFGAAAAADAPVAAS